MSRFLTGRASRRIASRAVKSHVRVVHDGTEEAREVERDHEMLVGSLCPYCERVVAAAGHSALTCPAGQEAIRRGLA